MEEGTLVTHIKTYLTKYLFVPYPCPACNTVSALSLDMIRTLQEVRCLSCNNKFQVLIPELQKPLDGLFVNFGLLYKQLQENQLDLLFAHDPVATIWSQDQES